jgi:hypothetical protein
MPLLPAREYASPRVGEGVHDLVVNLVNPLALRGVPRRSRARTQDAPRPPAASWPPGARRPPRGPADRHTTTPTNAVPAPRAPWAARAPLLLLRPHLAVPTTSGPAQRRQPRDASARRPCNAAPVGDCLHATVVRRGPVRCSCATWPPRQGPTLIGRACALVDSSSKRAGAPARSESSDSSVAIARGSRGGMPRRVSHCLRSGTLDRGARSSSLAGARRSGVETLAR